MKRLLLSIVLAVMVVTVAMSAPKDQKVKPERPDMERIKSEVNNPNSKYYFTKLMQQWERRDTSLTREQMRHLYLGYVFQEDYNPYRRSRYASTIDSLYYKSQHTSAECDSIIKYAELTLKDDPFDMRQMSFLIYAFREKKKNNLAAIYQYKLNHLLEAIVSTGTGLDPDNAWVIINPQHEYNLLNFLNYVVEKQEDRPPHYDYITVKPKGETDDPKGFYFNVLWVLKEYYRKFPDAE